MKTTIPETRIVMEYGPIDSREEFLSPQSPDDVLANCGNVCRAVEWARSEDVFSDEMFHGGPTPIGVAIYQRGNVVTVRWYTVMGADPDDARAALHQAITGAWKREEGYCA